MGCAINAHINVEVCSSIKSVKYIFKYVHKGHDCANIELRTASDAAHERLEMASIDEISTFLNTRYVIAPEAMWRLFEYRVHNQSHVVICLALHLDHQLQSVYFRLGNEEAVFEQAKVTTLIAWFHLNRHDEGECQW